MPRRTGRAAAYILRDPARFSANVLDMALYPYQLEPLRAILDSVVHRRGHEFLLIFPRQSGKNEAVAHLLTYLLVTLHRRGGNIVFGAVGDGCGRMKQRMEQRLDNYWCRGRWRKAANPDRLLFQQAALVFLSAHPAAASRGETAHSLLVLDEFQDLDPSHVDAVFQPMRAANNATALYIGTVKFSHDALWRKKAELEALQEKDGLRRVYLVPPEEVTAANPLYARFLAGQEARLGRDHPIVQSEYYLRPLDAEGGLFPPRRLALMRGTHPRLLAPLPTENYIATLDVAGQDEAATDPVARLANPGRDYTVATIFRIIPPDRPAPGPTYEAVDVFVDHGSRHFQESPGQPALVHRLLAWLRHWRVAHVVADATGAGEGLVDWLAATLGQGRVTPFKFTALSKAALGSRFISIVETGRFRYFAEGEQLPMSDSWWFFQQVAACTYELLPDAPFDRGLRWSVPDTASVSTPAGPQPIHDDRLLSAALIAAYDELAIAGSVPTGRAASTLIPPRDPLSRLRF